MFVETTLRILKQPRRRPQIVQCMNRLIERGLLASRKAEFMSFLFSETTEARILEVTVSSKLTKEVYQAFVAQTEAAINKYGKIRVLFLTLGFQGWKAGPLWEDLHYELKHFEHIERLAIVGETKWEHGMSMFCGPFKSAVIKYFEHSDLQNAREWVCSLEL